MKIILPLILSSFTLLSVLSPNNQEVDKASAAVITPTYTSSLTKTIDLSKNTDAEIRGYYSSLNSLSASERSGANLLKNLSPILQDMDYYSYTNIWKIYEITDREWALSPASGTTYGTYNSTTETITNYEYGSSSSNRKNDPYVRTLYRNRDENGVTVQAGRIKEWDSHTASGTNREHIWPQSRGFKDTDEASGPAGTDLHHLRSGDGYVNQTLHNNYAYGYVKTVSAQGTDKASYLAGNKLGVAKNTNADDKSTIVFEPQDSDKGDIARAVFYMAACYNNLAGDKDITEFNPYLTIVDYIYNANDNSVYSNETTPVSMSKLSDLLEWHKLDPVDEFEIYRNDLIYNNYQHNRNPFIDFPDWVDVIWGNEGLTANPQSDKIHEEAAESVRITLSETSVEIDLENAEDPFIRLTATTSNNKDVTWSVGDSTVVKVNMPTSKSGEQVVFTALKPGNTTITATASDGTTATCAVRVFVPGFVNVQLSKTEVSVSLNETFTLTAISGDEQPINWSFSEDGILSVNKTTSNSGEKVTFTALKEGEVTIIATSSDGTTATCKVSVTPNNNLVIFGITIEPWMLVAAGAIGAVFLITIIVVLANSKKARAAVAKQIKKQVKSKTKSKSKKK